MIEDFIKYIQKEWAVLSGAPWTFAILSAIVFGIAFAANRWRYHGIIENLRERLASYKERLEGKDSQLDDYRERLHLTPASGSSYAKLTHKELQEKVLQYVTKVREWFAKVESENRRLADNQWHTMITAITEEEKNRLWVAHSNTLTSGLFNLVRDFEEKFKVDAILLRDEMLSRLPPEQRTKESNNRYENPVNTFCIREIADDLERKAKRLC